MEKRKREQMNNSTIHLLDSFNLNNHKHSAVSF